MRSFMQNFWRDESGQDLIEYTLLLAFVALASASIFISAGNSVSTIWGNANAQLANGASSLAPPGGSARGVLKPAPRSF